MGKNRSPPMSSREESLFLEVLELFAEIAPTIYAKELAAQGIRPSTERGEKRDRDVAWKAANPESHREHNRRYREAHKEEIREYNRRYREAHKEEIREYNHKYREAHNTGKPKGRPKKTNG